MRFLVQLEPCEQPVSKRLPMAFTRANFIKLAALFRLGGHSQNEIHRGLDPLAGKAQLQGEMRGGAFSRVLRAIPDEDVVGFLHLSDQEIDLCLLLERTDGSGKRRMRQRESEERRGSRFTTHSNL